MLFDKWPSPLFEANFWNTTLAGLRVAMPLLLAALLLTIWIVERGHGRVPPRLVRRLAGVFIVGGYVVYYGAGNPNIRHPGFYQPQAYYHDYLGQKYRNELASVSLVECTLAAEKALGKAQSHSQRYVYTDMESVAPVLAAAVPSASDPTVCANHFTPERWDAFRSDVEWFLGAVKADEWARLQRARPDVKSPAWALVVSPFTQAPASEARFRTLALAEPVLHAAALTALTWGFGPVAAALMSVTWGCQPFFAFTGGAALVGNLWLVAWLVGLAVWRRAVVGGTQRSAISFAPIAAGALIGFGACLNPPSALALLPLAAATAARLRKTRSVTLGWVVTALIGSAVLLSLASTRYGSLERYTSALAQRRATPELSDVGLPALLSNQGMARYRFQRIESAPDPAVEWRTLRAATHPAKLGWERVAILALTGFVSIVAWRRRSLGDAALLGLSLVPLATQPISQNLGLLAIALFGARRTELAVPVLTAVAGCAALANQSVFPDDCAALLTALLWVTTFAVLLSGSWTWLVRRSRPSPALLSASSSVADGSSM